MNPVVLSEQAAGNHRAWFHLAAEASGGKVFQEEGVSWTIPGKNAPGQILFPELPEKQAGETLDAIITDIAKHPPDGMVGCWSLSPARTPDLDIRLLARGFQPGWQPCWMWLDLSQLSDEFPVPSEVRIVPENEAAHTPIANDLPYPPDPEIWQAMRERAADRLQRFVAVRAARVVGHATVFTDGNSGTAGIYSVGVMPEARGQGIGAAVTAAACRWAREQNVKWAVLNATGETMYRRVGFTRVGWGDTWWLDVPRRVAADWTAEHIRLAEWVGRGEIEQIRARKPAVGLDSMLPNGMSLIALALHCEQRDAALWLAENNAPLDVLSAWELGGAAHVRQLLDRDPASLNTYVGTEKTATALHSAVEQENIALIRLLLAAGANPNITDTVFHSTPLGWAEHLGKTTIAGLLRGDVDSSQHF